MEINTRTKSAFKFHLRQAFLLFSGLFISSISFISVLLYGFYHYECNNRLKVISQDLKGTLDMHLGVANATLKDVASDLILIYKDRRIPLFLENPLSDQRFDLNQFFLNMSAVKGRYDQIRIISNDGRELLRVNYNNGTPQVVEISKLQHKGNRYYVANSFLLPPGQIYKSPIDLNVEHGQIERPLKPMLRLGTPLLNKHGKKNSCFNSQLSCRQAL